MKKFFACLLALTLCLSCVSVSAQSASEWTLETADAQLTIGLLDGAPAVFGLSTKASGVNMVAEEPVEIELPEYYTLNNQLSRFAWVFTEAQALSGEMGDGVALFFEDAASQSQYRLYFAGYTAAEGPFQVWAELENKSAEQFSFTLGDIVSVKAFGEGEALAWWVNKEGGIAEGFRNMNGTHFKGTGIYSMAVNARASKAVWTTADQNWNAGGSIPMVWLDYGSARGVYAGLEWPYGQIEIKGKSSAKNTASAALHVNLNNKSDFETRLNAGDTFLVPTAYLGVYDGDLDEGSNHFKNWFFDFKVPDNLRENADEPYTQVDMQILPKAMPELGIESTKWDYGWWSDDKVGNWMSHEGSWVLRSPGYFSWISNSKQKNMPTFAEHMKEKGLKNWTVYVLLHDTQDAQGNPTDKFNDFNSVTHPEWFSNRRVDTGMGRSADLGNAECVEFLKTTMYDFFTKNGIGTWRSDFEPICATSNLDNRHFPNGTDVQYWTATGFYDLVDYLIENIEGFRYESCSSGGSLKDYATLSRATVINTEDTANYLSARMAFYDSSYAIHPAQLQMPVNPDTFCPESSTYFWPIVESDMENFEDAMKTYGMRTIILGAPMFASWSGNITLTSYKFQLNSYLQEHYLLYQQRVRPLQREGNLYHILPRPDGINWDGVMYAAPETENDTKAVVFLFKPSNVGDVQHINLRGLKEDVSYQLTFEDDPAQNVVMTGKDLMETGLDVTIPGDVGSEMIWLSEAAQ